MDTNLLNKWTLQNKTAIVTGGTKGIGNAIAEKLLIFGAEVLIAARSGKEIKNTIDKSTYYPYDENATHMKEDLE